MMLDDLLHAPTVAKCGRCGAQYDRHLFDLLPLPVGWDARNGAPTMGDEETGEVLTLRRCITGARDGACKSTVARMATEAETLAHWMRELGKL